ncbi:MAG: hypothetical protein ACTJGW_14395 [Vibrio casei]|uniref:hypothetical protein n=1 Tax=Vibrio casei TaxID=673372 RepID=UPI001867348D|nr:hypothetical protein [Vibrio casei]
MKTLYTTMLATLVFSTAAMASTSTGIKLDVISHVSGQAVVKVTQDGQPLANYPVEIKGLGEQNRMTDENGQLVVSNAAGSGSKYILTVEDAQGQQVSEQVFLKNKRQ